MSVQVGDQILRVENDENGYPAPFSWLRSIVKAQCQLGFDLNLAPWFAEAALNKNTLSREMQITIGRGPSPGTTMEGCKGMDVECIASVWTFTENLQW